VRFTVTPVVFEMRRLYIVQPRQRQVRATVLPTFLLGQAKERTAIAAVGKIIL